jgi:hypothetical protein
MESPIVKSLSLVKWYYSMKGGKLKGKTARKIDRCLLLLAWSARLDMLEREVNKIKGGLSNPCRFYSMYMPLTLGSATMRSQ